MTRADDPARPSDEAPEFWLTSGFHLLARDGRGHLLVTDDYLRAYLGRPEIAPEEASCAAERELHAALLENPHLPVAVARLADLADPTARDNYAAVLALRDLLLAHGTLEAAYMSQFAPGPVSVAPLFLDQMAHAILRNILDGCGDPVRVRAAELLFRKQKVNLADGAILLADDETVEMYAATGGFGGLGQLLVENGTPPAQVELDVLSGSNARLYWERSDRFDTVIDISFGRFGLDALCRVLEAWIGHFLGVAVRIEPVQSIHDERWRWHVGLDGVASGILNDLYRGATVSEARLAQILSLFRLEFLDAAQVVPDAAGRAVYLAVAMAEDKTLQLKPQNLLVNLPLAVAA